MSAAPPKRIAQLLRLTLSSAHDGETLAAVAALRRLIDLHDLGDAVERGLKIPEAAKVTQNINRSTDAKEAATACGRPGGLAQYGLVRMAPAPDAVRAGNRLHR